VSGAPDAFEKVQRLRLQRDELAGADAALREEYQYLADIAARTWAHILTGTRLQQHPRFAHDLTPENVLTFSRDELSVHGVDLGTLRECVDARARLPLVQERRTAIHADLAPLAQLVRSLEKHLAEQGATA